MKIEFEVRGNPKPQPRPRAFFRHGAKHAGIHNPPVAEAWKLLVYGAAESHVPEVPLAGPLFVLLSFTLERPQSHYGTGRNADKLKPSAPPAHLNVPDGDNLEKAVWDLLTNMRMWTDDRVITDHRTRKRWGKVGGMRVLITPDEGEWSTDGDGLTKD